jgi:hypothetical protein
VRLEDDDIIRRFTMLKYVVMTLLAAFGLSTFTGCEVYHDDDYGYRAEHAGYRYHDHDWDHDHWDHHDHHDWDHDRGW